jgi:hypothetical protein
MSAFKPSLVRVFRDRSTNNIIVGILIAFSLSNFVMFAAESLGVPGWASWWSVTWRQLAGFVISLILAEIISRFAR